MFARVPRLIIIIAVFVVAGGAQNARAESHSSREYLIKAAFLYNFAKFVEWPAEAFADDQAPITLCIFGKDPFGAAVESIQGKTAGGRKMVVKRSTRTQDLKKCHIVFISSSERKRLGQILVTLKDRHVLTVGDMKNFAQRGGIINFVKVGNKIRFEINVDSAERTGLKISSKLLKLANIVTDKQRGEKD